MQITSFEQFTELAQRGTFVPVYKEIVADLLTPVSAFLKVAEHSDYAFLLESVEGGEQVARYSFLGKDPFLIVRAREGKVLVEHAGDVHRVGQGVRAHDSRADGRLPFAIRARAAALHGRGSGLPGLRRGGVVRAGHAPAGHRGAGRGGVHALRHGAGLRPCAAPDPRHRQRPHHRGRGSRGAVPVRVRARGVRGARARARAVEERAAAPRIRSRCLRTSPRNGSRRWCERRRSTSRPATSTRSSCRSVSRPPWTRIRSRSIARCGM